MKRILIITLFSISLNSFGQQWIEYKMDSNLTIHVPDNFTVIDTLGQHFIKARITNGIILVQRIPNKETPGSNIENKAELMKSYEGFPTGFIGSQKGKLKKKEIIERDGLQMIHFSYSASMGQEKQIRYCLVTFLNENWYVINFWEVESATDELAKDREKLFSSAKFAAGLSLKNQLSYSMERSLAYKSGYVIGQIIFFGVLLLIVILVVRWISNARKKKIIKDQLGNRQ